MIFTSLASGSSGNCSFVAAEHSRILIDCGLSAKRIDESLKAIGFSADSLDAIFLTHEHSDHIKGLKRLMSAYHIPVYASTATLGRLADAARDEFFRFAGSDLMHAVSADQLVQVGDFSVLPFQISHDAAGPLAYRIEVEQSLAGQSQAMQPQLGQFSLRQPQAEQSYAEQSHAEDTEPALRRHVSVAVMTDTGFFDDAMRDHLLNLDILLLEANHDRGMLSNGPYPMALKRRIMSRQGHLSNNAAGQLLAEIINPRLCHVFLGHLSKENNTPELALATVRREIAERLSERAAVELPLSVAPYDSMSEVIRL